MTMTRLGESVSSIPLPSQGEDTAGAGNITATATVALGRQVRSLGSHPSEPSPLSLGAGVTISSRNPTNLVNSSLTVTIELDREGMK